jgi:hypothetical protein
VFWLRQVVNGDDLKITDSLHHRPKNEPADATESIDTHANSHCKSSLSSGVRSQLEIGIPYV